MAAPTATDPSPPPIAARSADKLAAIAEELDPSGERVAQLPTDIGDVEQCRALAKLAVDRFGAVDGVVQVAAYDGFLAGLEGTGDDDWRAVIESPDVDVVVCTAPNMLHLEIVEAAAAAGKAIMCEKPVSLDVANIHETLKVVEKNKSTLMIGFNRRFDPSFAEVEKRIRKGDIGEVELVTVISRDPSPPPAEYVEGSGGIFADMMIHDFDMARFLMGEEFVVVQALGSSLVDKGIGEAGDVDTAAVQMQTKSGRIAVITRNDL